MESSTDYTELSPVPVCILCNEKAPYMFFPCGCTQPVHGPCLSKWTEHNRTCPRCRASWIHILPATIETPVIVTPVIETIVIPKPRRSTNWLSLLIIFVFVLVCIAIGVIWSMV